MVISALMLSRGNRILTKRGHGCCVSGQMNAKERKYVTLMYVGSPGVILWHVVCPKLCRALPEALHLTCLWPGIINYHLVLLLQESDCCPPAFSEIMAKRLFVASLEAAKRARPKMARAGSRWSDEEMR